MWSCALHLIVPLFNIRCTNSNIQVLEIEHWIRNAGYLLVGQDNVLDVLVDKVVEGVDVLLHQSLDGEESGHQLPFVL